MGFYVAGGHAFGVHGQDRFLDVLAHTGLILFRNLRLKLALTVSPYSDVYISKARAQSFAAVLVPAVIRVLVLVVVLAIAQFVIQPPPSCSP